MKKVLKNNINGFFKNKLFISLLILFGVCFGFLSTYLYYGNIPLKNHYEEKLKSSNLEDFRILPSLTLTDNEIKQIVQDYKINDTTNITLEELVGKYNVNLSEYYNIRIKNLENKYNFSSELFRRKYFIKNSRTYFLSPYNGKDKINKLTVVEGKKNVSKDEVLISVQFARMNNIKIGESITLYNHSYKVVGLYYQPSESLIYNSSYSKRIGNMYNAGVFLYMKDYDAIEGMEDYIFVARFDKRLNKKQLNNQLQIMMKDKKVGQIFNSNDLTNFKTFQSNFETSISIMSLSLTILSVVIAILLIQILHNQIKKYSKSLAILRAMGYNKLGLSTTFFIFALPTSLGILLGGILGYFKSFKFIDSYLDTFNFIRITPSIDIPKLILLLLGLFICISVFSIGVVFKTMSNSLLDSISERDSLKINYRAFRVNKYLDRLPFIIRVRNSYLLNSISRACSVLIMSFISFFLLNFAFSLSNIANKPISDYSNSLNFKYEYIYQYAQQNNNGKLDKNLSYSTTLLLNTEEDSWKTTNAQFVDEDYNSLNIYNSKDKSIFKSLKTQNSIIIPKKVSDKYGVRIGDHIKIKSSSGIIRNMTVVEINPISYDNTLYFNREYLKKFDDSLTSKSYNRRYTNKLLGESEDVEYQTKSDKVNQIKKLVSSSLSLIPSIIGITVFIVVSISILLASLNLRDNKRSISIFILQGYSKRQILNMLINVYSIVLIVGMFISLMNLELLFDVISSYINSLVDIYIEFNVSALYIILSACVIFLVYQLSLFATYRSLNKIKISEVNYE